MGEREVAEQHIKIMRKERRIIESRDVIDTSK